MIILTKNMEVNKNGT